MRVLALSLAIAFALHEPLRADSFNLSVAIGGDDALFPEGSRAFLVADAGEDGFDFLSSNSLLRGSLDLSQGSLLGDDDIIISADLPLVSFGQSGRGFSFPDTLFETINFPTVSAGDEFAVVWFPDATSDSGNTFFSYRSDAFSASEGATAGFFVPEAGDTTTVVALSESAGGSVSNADFSSSAGTIPSPASLSIVVSGQLSFGQVPLGSSETLSFTVTNVGSAELTVTSILLPAGFSSPFSGVIAPGSSQQVEVMFSPTNATAYSGRLSVESNAAEGNSSLFVSGTGVVRQTSFHPADIGVDGSLTDLADDGVIGINELTAYIAAYRSGDVWSSGPNPIDINYVTRAIFLWRNGERYTENTALAPLISWQPTNPQQ